MVLKARNSIFSFKKPKKKCESGVCVLEKNKKKKRELTFREGILFGFVDLKKKMRVSASNVVFMHRERERELTNEFEGEFLRLKSAWGLNKNEKKNNINVRIQKSKIKKPNGGIGESESLFIYLFLIFFGLARNEFGFRKVFKETAKLIWLAIGIVFNLFIYFSQFLPPSTKK